MPCKDKDTATSWKGILPSFNEGKRKQSKSMQEKFKISKQNLMLKVNNTR